MRYGCLIAAGLISQLAFAQLDGWNNGKGKGVFAASAGAEIGLDYSAGDSLTGITRTITSLSLFGSYGILDDLDVSVMVPYVTISNGSGLQDGSVYLKWLPSKSEKHSLGVAVGAGAPLSDYDTDNGLGTIGQQAEVIRFAGLGQLFLNNNYFIGGSFRYELASDPVPSTAVSEIRFGNAGSDLFWEVEGKYQWSEGIKDYLGENCNEPETFREIAVEFVRLSIKGYKPLNNTSGVSASVTYNEPLRNSDRAIGIFGSYVMRFGKQ